MPGLEEYVGQVLDDKYRLEELLGQGGMGAVYLATHLGTERYVALKLIAPQFMRNEEFVERFKREARAAGRLRHPNVVDVTDFGFAEAKGGQVAYLVMEYLDGCTLGDVLAEEKRLPVEWVVDILEQVCSAVHEAHHQGIVHRDLKPDNIWLEPNRLGGYRVKVLDFGIAKLAEATASTDDDELPATESVKVLVASSIAVVAAQTSQNLPRPNPADLEKATLLQTPSHPDLPGDGDELLTQHLEVGSEDRAAREAPPTGGVPVGDLSAEANETKLFAAQTSHHRSAASPTEAWGRRREQFEDPDVDRDGTLLFSNETRSARPHTAHIATTPQGSALTRVGAIMGTPLYMSPEQCGGGHLDARSDVYSLGVIAYQMLAGEPPFGGNTSTVMRAHREEPPAPLREKTKKLRKRAAQVVMTALAKDPADRPQTAAAFASSLRAQAEGIGSLYRRAFALYSEYFPKFLRLSFIAHIPVIVFTVLILIVDLTEKNLRHRSRTANVVTICVIALLALIQVAAYFVAASSISGMTAVIVTQLSAAPLRPVQLSTAFAVLKRRWRPFLNTSIRMTVRIILGWLLIIPGIVITIRYCLYAPVVLLEGLEKKAARVRARQLASRSWRTVIIITLLQVIIPFTVSALIGRISFHPDKQVGTTAHTIYQHLSGLVNIVIVPLMSIVPALLYLRMRQLGGEPLSDLLPQIEDEDAGRSNWQQRMRTRVSLHTQGQKTNSQKTTGQKMASQ
jgi:serine/threonine protein kinase